MKRRNVLCALIGVSAAAGLGGCGDGAAEKREVEAPAAAGWAIPPRIEAVLFAEARLIVRGQAQPGGRVVLRSAEGAAFAAVADDAGKFEIRMATPAGPVILTPETQVGQEASPALQRLLILDGGRGPIALLAPGAPTRRLDRSPALGAVDSDGASLLISGRSAPDGAVEATVDGRTLSATAGPDGGWRLAARDAGIITVGGATFAYPGDAGGAGWAERAGQGWRVRWAAPDGARQSTWLPIP